MILDTPEQIEAARILAVRSALSLEIRTGMKMSNRYSPMILANKITGCTKRNKRAAYDALNTFIVENLGSEFDRPLN